MKFVSFLSLSLLVFSTIAFAEEGRPGIVEIRTVDGDKVWVSKKVLKEVYDQTFGPVKPALSPVEKAKAKLKIQSEAYDWAVSYNGMNATPSTARTVAEDLASRENAVEAFAAYKKVYEFATSYQGINTTPSKAKELAENLSKIESPIEMFEVFEKAYKHATSYQGMNLTASEALKYALKSIGIDQN